MYFFSFWKIWKWETSRLFQTVLKEFFFFERLDAWVYSSYDGNCTKENSNSYLWPGNPRHSVLKFKFLVNLKIFRKLTFSVIWIYFGQLSLSLWRCKQKFNIIKIFNLKNMTIVLVFTHVFKVKMYSFINYLIDKNKIL